MTAAADGTASVGAAAGLCCWRGVRGEERMSTASTPQNANAASLYGTASTSPRRPARTPSPSPSPPHTCSRTPSPSPSPPRTWSRLRSRMPSASASYPLNCSAFTPPASAWTPPASAATLSPASAATTPPASTTRPAASASFVLDTSAPEGGRIGDDSARAADWSVGSARAADWSVGSARAAESCASGSPAHVEPSSGQSVGDGGCAGRTGVSQPTGRGAWCGGLSAEGALNTAAPASELAPTCKWSSARPSAQPLSSNHPPSSPSPLPLAMPTAEHCARTSLPSASAALSLAHTTWDAPPSTSTPSAAGLAPNLEVRGVRGVECVVPAQNLKLALAMRRAKLVRRAIDEGAGAGAACGGEGAIQGMLRRRAASSIVATSERINARL